MPLQYLLSKYSKLHQKLSLLPHIYTFFTKLFSNTKRITVPFFLSTQVYLFFAIRIICKNKSTTNKIICYSKLVVNFSSKNYQIRVVHIIVLAVVQIHPLFFNYF